MKNGHLQGKPQFFILFRLNRPKTTGSQFCDCFSMLTLNFCTYLVGKKVTGHGPPFEQQGNGQEKEDPAKLSLPRPPPPPGVLTPNLTLSH